MPFGPVRKRVARVNRGLYSLLDRLTFRAVGREERPVLFEVDAVCPELRRLDESWEVIREELETLLGERSAIPRYHDADPRQRAISAAEGNAWRTYVFYKHDAGERLGNAWRCPRTTELVSRIPGVFMAFFSILEPGRSIPAHNGPTYSYLRYHLGLRVPADAPPSIRIRDRYVTWRERESFLFDDSHNHEIFNESEELRVVLIVDIARPVAWPLRCLLRTTQLITRLNMTEDLWRESLAPMRVGSTAGRLDAASGAPGRG